METPEILREAQRIADSECAFAIVSLGPIGNMPENIHRRFRLGAKAPLRVKERHGWNNWPSSGRFTSSITSLSSENPMWIDSLPNDPTEKDWQKVDPKITVT